MCFGQLFLYAPCVSVCVCVSLCVCVCLCVCLIVSVSLSVRLSVAYHAESCGFEWSTVECALGPAYAHDGSWVCLCVSK